MPPAFDLLADPPLWGFFITASPPGGQLPSGHSLQDYEKVVG